MWPKGFFPLKDIAGAVMPEGRKLIMKNKDHKVVYEDSDSVMYDAEQFTMPLGDHGWDFEQFTSGHTKFPTHHVSIVSQLTKKDKSTIPKHKIKRIQNKKKHARKHRL
jgi:hypothetical protein